MKAFDCLQLLGVVHKVKIKFAWLIGRSTSILHKRKWLICLKSGSQMLHDNGLGQTCLEINLPVWTHY